MREIASRTEQYWCPIKHARRLIGAHALYAMFEDYGDADGYRQRLAEFQKTLAKEPKVTRPISRRKICRHVAPHGVIKHGPRCLVLIGECCSELLLQPPYQGLAEGVEMNPFGAEPGVVATR